ncbi:MAG TPA: hypothetical protein VN258_05815 [Mobilitalea sp.]|nr:hypothetical protein [Mobilitalea sp.]
MPFLTKYLLMTLLISPLVMLTSYIMKRNKRNLYYSFINTVLSTCFLLREILSYGATETTLMRKITFFFHNDVSTLFYYAYLPSLFLGSILPIIMFIITYILRNKNNSADTASCNRTP